MKALKIFGALLIIYAVLAFLVNVFFASQIGNTSMFYVLLHALFNPFAVFVAPHFSSVVFVGANPIVWSIITGAIGSILAIFG